MTNMATSGASEKTSTGGAAEVAYAGAAALVIAAVWYGLASLGVTVDAEPAGLDSLPFQQRAEAYYGWLVTTFAQERFYIAFAVLGFLCVTVTVATLRQRLFWGDTPALFGVVAISAGSGLWIVGNVFALGGHHAVAIVFARPEPVELVHSINLTVELIDDGFELATFVALAVGVLALALPAMRADGPHLTWGRFSGVVALVMLATSGAYAARSYRLLDLLLVLGGAVLLPSWLVWSGRLLREPRG